MDEKTESKYPLKKFGLLEYFVFLVFGSLVIFLFSWHINQFIQKGFSFSLLFKMISYSFSAAILPVSLILLRTKYYKYVLSTEKKHVLIFLSILFLA